MPSLSTVFILFHSIILFRQLVLADDKFVRLNWTQKNCKEFWSEALLPADYESRIICFHSHLNAREQWKIKFLKPSKRFQLEQPIAVAEKECSKCLEQGPCNKSMEYDWLKIQNNGTGVLEMESSQMHGKIFYIHNKLCELQDGQPLNEYSNGAFLIDLLKENGTFKNHLVFLYNNFGPFYSQKSHVGNDSAIEKSTTLITTKSSTIDQKTTPSITTIPPDLYLGYSKKLKPVYKGTKINVRAQVKADAKNMQINLLHDAPAWHAQLGATLLHIEVDFDKYFNNGQLSYGAYFNDTWFGNGTWIDKNKDIFKKGESFNCSMLITQIEEDVDSFLWHYYKKLIIVRIDVNGKLLGEFTGNMPIWSLNWLQVAGDITVDTQPEIEYAAAQPHILKFGLHNFKHELHTRLNDGAVLCIEGEATEVKKNRLFLYIHLFREANERSELIGDTLLQIEYTTEDSGYSVKSFFRGREMQTPGWGHSVSPLIEGGKHFAVLIKVIKNRFNITWPGDPRGDFEHDDQGFMPWAANWLTVDGFDNVSVNADSELCKGKSVVLPANMRQLYPNKTLVAGDEIIISGEVENAELVEILLLREALEWHERFGQTVLRIQIKQDIMECNSYNRKQWTFPTVSQIPLDQPLVKEQNFTLKITVAKKYYAISYGNEGELIRYAHQLPLWAVEYITVTGLKQPEKGCQKLITIFPLDNYLNNNCSHGLLMLEFGGRNGKWDYDSKSINLTAEETKRMEGKTQLFVQIKNHGYFYVFTVGDPRQPVVKNTFWPDQWKEGKGIGNGNASLHVEASRMVGGIVEVIDSDPLDSIMIPPRSFKLTKAVANGSVITFRAKVDENTNGFKIRLLHDAPECHFYLGATVMLIEVDFNNEIVKWMSYDNQKEHNHGSQPNNNQFEAGKVFECKMVITQQDDQQKKIQIAVFVDDELLLNFTGNLPIWTLNWMQTEGGIKLFDKPIFDIAEETSKLFKHELDHLLNHGDVLCIDGRKAAVEEPFNVYLFHEANEWSYEIGDVALQMKYVPEQGKFGLDTFLHDTNSTTNLFNFYDYVVKYGQVFNIKIEVKHNKYHISSMDSVEVKVFEDEVNQIPPWAANWLTVEGAEDVTLNAGSNLCASAEQKPLPGNMLQLYSENMLEIGDEIVVKGKVENAELVEIFLFREALEWHQIIGQTVLSVQFKAPFDNFTYNSYIDKKWAFLPAEGNTINSRAIDSPLVKEQTFELKILAANKNWFKIVYKDAKGKQFVLQYEDSTMPIWAVQYVVVNGLEIPKTGEPPLIKVERKEEH